MRRRGFTLIEMAIILVILGLILGIGTGFMVQFIKWNKRKETGEKLSTAVESVIGFVKVNGYLPDASEFKSVFGGKDEFGQDFIYVYPYKLIKSFFEQYESKGYDVSICDVKSVSLRIIDNGTNSTLSNVAFFVFSKGEDYRSNTYCDGSLITDSGECNGTVETDTTEDYLKAVTLYELKQYLGCVGIPLKILNNSLPDGVVGESYNASVFASGGLPFLSGGKYEWCYDAPDGWGGLTVSPEKVCSSDEWGQADEFEISGIPASSGTYQVKVCVRDNNGSEDEDKYMTCKWFVISINDSSDSGKSVEGEGSCNNYTFTVSVTSNPRWAHPISTSILGKCVDWGRTRGTYSYSGSLDPNATITVMEAWWCSGSNVRLSGTVQTLDTNEDCKIEVSCVNGKCLSQ